MTNKNSKGRKTKISMILIILAVIFTFGINSVSADSSMIYVNGSYGNDAWDGFSWETAKLTIGNGVDTVSNGGTVNIADGTYTGSGNKNININKNMTINGQSKNGTVIDAQNSGKIFKIYNATEGEELYVTISNMTLKNALSSTNGGAISNVCYLTVNNCTFTGNDATNSGVGGAIWTSADGTAVVRDSTFIDNTATDGGAIISYSYMELYNCIFTGNSATDGGAVYGNGYLSVDNSTFTDNYASSRGGAIYCFMYMYVTNSSFISNNANQGGALYSYFDDSVSLTVTGSNFEDNDANYGGAIYKLESNAEIHFNRFRGNDGYTIYNNIGSYPGTVNATLNWWGSNYNPSDKVSSYVDVSTWLVLTAAASNSTIFVGQTSNITADLQHDNLGNYYDPVEYGLHVPDGIPVIFYTTVGTFDNSLDTITLNTIDGAVTTTLHGTSSGYATVYATVDSRTSHTHVTIIGGPDLEPTITETPVNPYTGTSHPVKVRVDNTGYASAGTFKVRLYDNGNLVGEEKTVDGLSADGYIDLTWDWTPAIGTPGNHNLTVVVDELYAVTEDDETNNNASVNVTAVGMPDLIATDITTNSTGTTYTGRPYTVYTTIRNNRDAATGSSFNVLLYDNETLVGQQTVEGGLDAWQDWILTWNWTPEIGTPGIHTLLTAIDLDNIIFESDDANNNMSANFTVTGMPDLIALNNMTTNSTGTIYTGLPYTVYTTIKNNRDAATGTSFKVKLYDNGVFVAEQITSALNAWEERTLTWSWTPLIDTPGLHTLLIATDTDNIIAESNETNNNNSTDFLVTGMPDIIALNNMTTNSTGTIYTGNQYTVSTTIKNNRDAATGSSFKVKLYDNGVFVAEQITSALNAWEERTLTWNWIPVINTVGLHTLLIITDTDFTVAESNETNNDNSSSFTVTGMPDLIVLNNMTTNSTGTTYTGLPYNVYTTIKNNRDAATGTSFKVKLYDNGVFVAEQITSALNAWQERTLTWSWTPGTVGSHTLMVIADTLGEIAESDEDNNNNTTAVTATGRPDILVLNNMTTNSTGTTYTGLPYTVSTTVKNTGDANAGPFYVELKDGLNSLGTQLVSNLAIGAEYTLNWNWVPGTVGLHNLLVITDIYGALFEINEENNNLTANFTATGRPELVPSNLTTSGTIYTNITYPVSVKISNNGDAATENDFKVKLYDNEDLVGEQTITSGLNIGDYRTLTWNWTPLTNGTHTLKIVTDTLDAIFEISETNNNITLNKNVVSVPDLTVISIQTPTTIYTGNTYTVTANIKNIGKADAGRFCVKFYDNGILFSKTYLDTLAIGASTPVYFNWTPTTNGTHTLKIIVDGEYNITESNESNNLLTLDKNVVSVPDLTVINIQTPTTIYTGRTYTVTANIKNIGKTAPGRFCIKFYDNGLLLTKTYLDTLAVGTSTPINFNWTPTTNGTHTLKVIVDGEYNITESNESNNLLTQDKNVIPLPDLTVISIQTPTTIYAGKTYTVTSIVANIGTKDAGMFCVKFYDNGILVSKSYVDSLAVGTNTQVNFTWNPLISGTHTLKVIVDGEYNITESNETNNLLTQDKNVIPLPDLTVISIQTPTTIYIGNTYTVTANIKNIGGADAERFCVKLYDNGNLIDKVYVDSLAANTTEEVNFNWTPTINGTHTLKVIVDGEYNITESNETNNLLTQNVVVT